MARRPVVPRPIILGCACRDAARLATQGVDDAGADAGVLQLTQATGCLNDGSVEFCVKTGDAGASVLAIAPSGGAARG
jgi:hypothetical protein